MDEHEALEKAIEAAGYSGCRKSKCGAIIWRPWSGPVSIGWSHPVRGYACDGSKDCNKHCIHAEQAVLLDALRCGKPINGTEILRVEVVDGKAVPSEGPSCWQCSKLLVPSGIDAIWLLHDGPKGTYLKRYPIGEFHRLTLENCGLHKKKHG